MEKLVHTAEPLVPQPRCFGVENAIEELKRHALPDIIQVTAEMIQAGGKTF
jgi:hypothetical protein